MIWIVLSPSRPLLSMPTIESFRMLFLYSSRRSSSSPPLGPGSRDLRLRPDLLDLSDEKPVQPDIAAGAQPIGVSEKYAVIIQSCRRRNLPDPRC